MKPVRLLLLGLAAIAPSLPAQNSTIVGLGNLAGIIPPVLAVQPICKPPDGCTTALPPPPAPFAGAAAWDDVLGASWVSEGTQIAVYAPMLGCVPPFQCACRQLCPFFRWPYPNSFITGMAIDSYKRILWISDHLGWIRWYAIIGPCQIQPMGGCQVPLPAPGIVITGLAFDIFTNSLLYVTSNWNPPTPGSSILYIAPAMNPCQPFCKWQVPMCPGGIFGPATGLTFDPCNRNLIITDGPQSLIAAWKQPCAFKFLSCCPAAPVGMYIGLGLYQSASAPLFAVSQKTTWTWSPCVGHGCPQCAAVPGSAGGLPQIGNPAFALTLGQGPNPPGFASAPLLMINWGNKCTPQPIKFPCGPITLYPMIDPLFWSTVAPLGPMGAPPCGLTANFPLPIPVLANLCGYKFCGQWVVVNMNPLGPANWCLTFSQQFDVQIGG